MLISLAIALLLGAAAAATGRKLLGWIGFRPDSTAQEWSLSVCLGFGLLMVMMLILGLSHLLYENVIYGALLLWGGFGLHHRQLKIPRRPVPDLRQSLRSPQAWLLLIMAIVLVLGSVRAMAPTHGATDPLAYQLALPRIYLQSHFLSFEQTITGALYPGYLGLLYVVGLALHGPVVAQLIHWFLGASTCVAVYALGRQLFGRATGVWAAVIFAMCPVVTIFASQGYIDVGLCFFQFCAFSALFTWCRRQDRSSLLLAALLTGIAIGVKHQGLPTLLIGTSVIAVLSLRTSGWRQALVATSQYAGIALLLLAPWSLRAYLASGNPMWPLLNGWFGGLPFGQVPVILSGTERNPDASLLQAFGALIPTLDWVVRRSSEIFLWKWTFQAAGAQKLIGPYFLALVPVGILYLRRRHLWFLGFCLTYHFVLIRALHMNPRYGLVLFACLSVLAGYGALRLAEHPWRWLRWSFIGVFACSAVMNGVWLFEMTKSSLPVALGRESEEVFLTQREPNYRVFRHVNQHLPEDSRILLQGIVKGFYCERPYLWDHPHQSVIEYDHYETATDLRRRFDELGITHVVRMIRIPPGRESLGFPQYFMDAYHEEFRKRHLKLLYRDESYVLFEVASAGKG